MASPRPPARPALCTVNRGARCICASANDTYYVGHALSSLPSNDLTVLRRFPTALAVTSATSHAFEIWAVTALSSSALLLGTRSGTLSHVRTLTPDDGAATDGTCGPALALSGRILSVHRESETGGACIAVTHAGISYFAADERGELSVTAVPRSEKGAEVVAGGFCGKRAFVARADGAVVLHDPRDERAVHLEGHVLGIPARAMRTVCAAGSKGAIVLGSQHGEIARLDDRMDTPVNIVEDAHPGWVSAVGEVGGYFVSAGADGIVKVWTDTLNHVATFPCHADSVYGIAGGESGFATVSYDGRVAINAYPVKT